MIDFRLENLGILFGLVALAIPLILHLLRRRLHDVVDWGAMQFLPDSIMMQKRRHLDEILLMLARMGTIALVVLALATPISTSGLLAPLRDRSQRDVVLVLDGSYSMGLNGGESPWEDAVRWAKSHLQESTSADRISIIVGREPPLVLGPFAERDEALAKLATLPAPQGNPGMPLALAEAWKLLQARSQATAKEIIVLTDGQKHGWADSETLAALENVGNGWRQEAEQARSDGWAVPSLRVVKVGGPLPAEVPNMALAPLTTSRSFARIGQTLTFHSALRLDGFSRHIRSREVKVLVDGKTVKALPAPDKLELKQGQVPLTFQQRFDEAHKHIVSVVVEPNPGQDVLPADNEQHMVIEVAKELPVLLVDGDKSLSPESSSYFLQRALGHGKENKGLLTVSHASLTPAMISPDKGSPGETAERNGELRGGDARQLFKPAVVVLADVPRLRTALVDALDRFVADGGGLLIVAGERVARERTFYNEHLYRHGRGWLPAHLEEAGSAADGIALEPRTFQHPALELLHDAAATTGDLAQARVSHWLKVRLDAKGPATPIARLANGDPFLLEKPYKQGRVILSTIPLDRSGKSTLPNIAEFPILVHELVSYLAGGRAASTVLRRGEPIRITSADASLGKVRLRTPELAEEIAVTGWPWVYANTGAIGTYQVNGSAGESWSFVVQPDLRESNLARCTEHDWDRVRERLPIVWQDDSGSVADSPGGNREELWWMLMIVLLGFLCLEVWMTRRLALGAAG